MSFSGGRFWKCLFQQYPKNLISDGEIWPSKFSSKNMKWWKILERELSESPNQLFPICHHGDKNVMESTWFTF